MSKSDSSESGNIRNKSTAGPRVTFACDSSSRTSTNNDVVDDEQRQDSDGRPIIGVSSLNPSRIIPPITEQSFEEKMANFNSGMNSKGDTKDRHGLTSGNDDNDHDKGEDISLNDLNLASSTSVGYAGITGNAIKPRGFLSSNQSAMNFARKQSLGTVLTNRNVIDLDMELEGDDGSDSVYLDLSKPGDEKGRKGFFNGMKAKIAKKNKLNKVYSPLAIVNLIDAARNGDLTGMVSLLNQNNTFNLNKVDKSNFGLLHYAAMNDNDFIARELLNRGADVDVQALDLKATPLHVAARMNSVKIAHVLLARCADVEKKTISGMTPLHLSARRGHVEMTQTLLKVGKANVSAEDEDKATPLHLAAMGGHLAVCELLVKYGADIRARDGNLLTPLMKAVMHGQLEVVNMFLERAKMISLPIHEYLTDEDNESNTCLHLAVAKRRTEVVQRLLDCGVNMNVRKKNGMSPLHLAAVTGATSTAMQLIQNGADIMLKDNEGMTPLHRASVYNRVELMAVLIHDGASIDDIDNEGFTPLLCAAWKGHVPAGDLLTTHGAKVQVFDNNHKSPLHWAAEMDHKAFVEFLLKNGAYKILDDPDNFDQTVLHYAAKTGNVEMIKLLIKYDVRGEVRDVAGKTPVHVAAMAGYEKCMEQLLQHTPMLLNEDDKDGMTPLLTSCLHGRQETVRTLLKMGADVTNVNDWHRSALMLAASNNHVETMSILIENSCDINAVDKDKNSALHICCDAGHIAAANLLIKAGADQSCSNCDGFTPLELAIEKEQGEIAATIIKSKDWRIAMESKDELMISPMRMLIEKLPDVALLVMDRCVHKTYKAPNKPSFTVKYEYTYIDPGPDDVSTSANGFRYFAVRTMCQYGREKLLAHELAQSILKRKWRRFGRVVYFLDLISYIIFLITITLFTSLTKIRNHSIYEISSDQDGRSVITNCPVINFTRSPRLEKLFYVDERDGEVYYESSFIRPAAIFIFVYCITIMLGEVIQIYVMRLKYFIDIFNLVDWVNLISALIYTYPPGSPLCLSDSTAGIIAMFFTWMKLIMYFKSFNTTGLYVLMFIETLSSLLKAMMVYIMFFVAFGVTFQMCLGSMSRFSRDDRSMLSVLTMTLGEFNKDDIFTEDRLIFQYPVLVLFLAFLFLMPMVINNLTIGIAVGDIDGIMKKAFIKRNSIQADYVYHLESKIPLCIQRVLFEPEHTVYVGSRAKNFLSWFFPREDAAFVETDNKSEPCTPQHIMDELQKQKATMSSLKLMMKQQGDMLRRMADRDGIVAKFNTLDALGDLYEDPPAEEEDIDGPGFSVA